MYNKSSYPSEVEDCGMVFPSSLARASAAKPDANNLVTHNHSNLLQLGAERETLLDPSLTRSKKFVVSLRNVRHGHRRPHYGLGACCSTNIACSASCSASCSLSSNKLSLRRLYYANKRFGVLSLNSLPRFSGSFEYDTKSMRRTKDANLHYPITPEGILNG
jgi:hypothetical protein